MIAAVSELAARIEAERPTEAGGHAPFFAVVKIAVRRDPDGSGPDDLLFDADVVPPRDWRDVLAYDQFRIALTDGDRGAGWDRCLRDAGFQVWGAV